MKKIASILVMTIVISAFLVIIGGGPAICGDHTTCVVNKIGVYPGLADPNLQISGYPIFLNCSDIGSEVMFYLSTDMGDAGLATALTALSLGQTVWARTTDDGPGGLVTVLYLNKKD